MRIPGYSTDPKARRIEFRSPDSSCNPYLAFAAMTMAVADGIKNKIDPGNPLDKLFEELEPHELEPIDSAPGDLEEALYALETDHDYLHEDNVFTDEVIHYWIKYKRENEIDELRHRPHPHEFSMYFDI